MIRHRTFFVTAALLGAIAGCVHEPPQGYLVPRRGRITNEIRDADLATIDGWGQRLEEVARRNTGATGERAYALAKAQAWIAFAREEYAAEPLDSTADVALAEGRRLVLALERDSVPADMDSTPVVMGTSRVHPELWSLADSIKLRNRYPVAADEVAAAEVALVRAGRLGPAMDRPACRVAIHLDRAERLLHDADVRTREVIAVRPDTERPDTVVVATRPDTVTPTPPARQPKLVAVDVHFALSRWSLGPSSRAVLDRVADVLARHPDRTIALEGHADPRGDPRFNLILSKRRALSVRDYLVAQGVDSARIALEYFGGARRATSERSRRAYALDRRVTLHLLTSDSTAVDVTDELQVERRDHWWRPRPATPPPARPRASDQP